MAVCRFANWTQIRTGLTSAPALTSAAESLLSEPSGSPGGARGQAGEGRALAANQASGPAASRVWISALPPPDLLGAELNVTLRRSPASSRPPARTHWKLAAHLWPAKVRAAVLPESISGSFPAAVPKAPKTRLQTRCDSHSCVRQSQKHIHNTESRRERWKTGTAANGANAKGTNPVQGRSRVAATSCCGYLQTFV